MCAQGFSVMKPSKEGQTVRAKKEVMRRRLLAFLAVLLRRFHVWRRDSCIAKVAHRSDDSLDRNDFLGRFLEMGHEGNCDEEMALMNKEVC